MFSYRSSEEREVCGRNFLENYLLFSAYPRKGVNYDKNIIRYQLCQVPRPSDDTAIHYATVV